MDEQLIGLNIRNIRSETGSTLTAIAKKISITKSTLSKIENGQISAPISTLMRIAQALEVPVADFFHEKKEEPPYILTRNGKGKIIQHNGTKLGYAYEGLALDKKDKFVEPFILTINLCDPPGEFYHEGQEFIYMLSGIMDFTIDEEVMRLKAGDSVFFDSETNHKTQIIGKKPVKFICVFIQNCRKLKRTEEGI